MNWKYFSLTALISVVLVYLYMALPNNEQMIKRAIDGLQIVGALNAVIGVVCVFRHFGLFGAEYEHRKNIWSSLRIPSAVNWTKGNEMKGKEKANRSESGGKFLHFFIIGALMIGLSFILT